MHCYRFGIEEEYFLVNRQSAAPRSELPKPYMAAAQKRLGERLTTEILQSQIEVATPPLTTSADARAELAHYRSVLTEVGKDHGVGIIAAGTHPLAQPHQQRMTRKRRYSKVISDLGMVGLGNPISGLHVHVEVPEPDLRVEIMHRLVPFLPLLLALSTSSPFWCGYPTGLLGYRNAANDALPRTGFPEMFRNLAEYETYVKTLVDAGIVPNATYVWWALRPSLQHPTLELRITDCCTAIEDSVAIAALFRALVRHAVHHPQLNATYSAVHRALVEENRWRAQRYGTDGTYIDLVSFEPISFRSWLDTVTAMVAGDIAHLGVEDDIQHLKSIPKRGTSAHLQLEFSRPVQVRPLAAGSDRRRDEMAADLDRSRRLHRPGRRAESASGAATAHRPGLTLQAAAAWNEVSAADLAQHDRNEHRWRPIMSDSGVSMLLGHASAQMLWLWFIGAFVLGGVLVYGVMKAGHLRRSERARLDRATEERQRQEDPYKRPT